MPIFIPPYCGEEIKSNAERKIYEILQNIKLKDTYILHSLGLPKHQTKIYGEIDFVVVCARGVACLEIKGGRVECREGIWHFIDRYNKEHIKNEGPFAQVIGNMFSLKENIIKEFNKSNNIKNILIASGVMFPDISFNNFSQEIINDIVYDENTLDITSYINNIFDYWKEKRIQKIKIKPSILSINEIKSIVSFFRKDFSFIPSLKNQLDSIDGKLLRLTAEQYQIMEALSSNNHLLIEGNAGTGKTLLAMNFALRKSKEGKKVLYLTYNKNLAMNIKNELFDNKNLKIINIHALFGEYIKVEIEKLKINPKYFEEELSKEFFEYLENLSINDLEKMKYDVLIMDEGQDILSPNYMYSLDILLKNGFEKGNWAVFYDEKQNLYNPYFKEGIELLLSYQCTKFKLFLNCRNTIQIGDYSKKESGYDLGTYIKEQGEEVKRISYTDDIKFKEEINNILKNLRKEGINLNEVVFLSHRKLKKSLLFKNNIEVNEIQDTEIKNNIPFYSTIHSYKGLDSKIVILFDVENIKLEDYAKYMYIAITRARILLYIVAKEDFWRNKIKDKNII